MLVQVEELKVFISRLLEQKTGKYSEVIVPGRAPDNFSNVFSLTRLRDGLDFSLDHYRSADPVKVLLYLCRERVTGKEYSSSERLVAGIKACDIKALQLLDRAMINNDFTDSAYAHWRSHTLHQYLSHLLLPDPE